MALFGGIGSKIFGSDNDRKLKAYQKDIDAINALEDDIAKLSDKDLRARTAEFKKQIENGTSLDDLLVPAFATVREAAKRTLKQRHFDVQLMGGMVLHEGKISEMKTGEGKTLVATLPVYLNALSSKGVHVVTVNDYLASRDAGWMGQIYEFLGLSVGCILPNMEDEDRQKAYACDVTYATNNELGFDYLRDNMKYHLEAMAQRGHNFVIVDEVDSILIDEARTPLIISGPVDDKTDLYVAVDKIIPKLVETDYNLDEKDKSVTLTEDGNDHLEEIATASGLMKGESLYDMENVSLVHHVNMALRAHKLFLRDRDYIVKNDEIIIIDEFTGRMMEGRRYSDGQHQAIEAKENVKINPENQTLASVTFQNYFRLYGKLAGMTGTALTEAEEFGDIYGLDVIEIPTNLPVSRKDDHDQVYRTEKEKFNAIIELVKDCQEKGQPCLVGTTSIEKSETLAAALKKQKIPHNVLNARYHEQEAEIVAQAGVPGAVTIATNMAGRGTDIQMGGNADMLLKALEGEGLKKDAFDKKKAKILAQIEVDKKRALDAGGLCVIGTERHESRRIDNQLRGRSGRQGDPGHSIFFLSLEDDLMRIFGSDRMDNVLQKLGLDEGEAIIHPWITKALEKAQAKVEARNFDIRKNLLKFDDVMNDQRKVVFEQRIDIMAGTEIRETITDMRYHVIEDMIANNIPEKAYAEQWNIEGLTERVNYCLGIDPNLKDWASEEGIANEEMRDRLIKLTDEIMDDKIKRIGDEIMPEVERSVLLQTIDHLWREHLQTLDLLRQYVGLRGYGQRDPLNEFKTDSFNLFETMLGKLREDVTAQMMRVELADEAPSLGDEDLPEMTASHENLDAPVAPRESVSHTTNHPFTHAQADEVDPENPDTWGKVPRNTPCPCGSGKKYKHCHGRL